jgi:hypothetical protein
VKGFPRPAPGFGAAAVAVLAVFAALTLVHLWPLVRLIATHNTPNTDTAINLWWVSQMSRQMIGDPLRLFHGNVLSPHPFTLAAVDHMLLASFTAIPLWVATHNPILVHNVMLVATYVLSGTFTAILVRRLAGSWWAGVVAGVAFAFSAFRWYELPHLHILTTEWIPLALLALDRLIERPSRARLAAFGAAALAVGLSSWHGAIVGGMLIAVVALWSLAQQSGPVRRLVAAIAGVALVVGLVLAPIAIPYRYTARWRLNLTEGERERGLTRLALTAEQLLPTTIGLGPPPEEAFGNARRTWTYPGLATWTLAAAAFLPRAGRPRRAPISRPLAAAGAAAIAAAGALVAAVWRGVAGHGDLAALLAPLAPVVVATAALALFAWLAARRQARDEEDGAGIARTRRARLTYTVVAAAGLLIAMGPRVTAWGVPLGAGLYQPDYLPLLGVLRAPERFGLFFAFGLAVLAGLGAARLLSVLPRRAGAGTAVVLLLLLNIDLRPAPLNIAEEDLPGPGHYWLATASEPGAVLELPFGRWKVAMRGGFLHDRRIVNGVGFVAPPGVVRLRQQRLLDQQSLDVIWEYFHPRLLLVRAQYYRRGAMTEMLQSIDARRDAVTIVARADEDLILRLVDRGRGPELRRWWPRHSLERARGLAFSAVAAGGHEGRADRVTITLNDHPVIELDGDAARDPAERRVPIEPGWLVPYENRFDVRAAYRYLPGQGVHPVGETGVAIPADIRVRADGRLGWYEVNGDRREVPPGYTLATIDPATGAVVTRASFDTARNQDQSASLARFVAALPAATPVVVVSEGAAAARLTDEGWAALRLLGLREDPRARRLVHAAIGVKGAVEGSVPEKVHRRATELSVGTPERREVQLGGFDLY